MLPKEQKLARGADPDVSDLWVTGMQQVLCWLLEELWLCLCLDPQKAVGIRVLERSPCAFLMSLA